jgi:hypothetical protein
MELESSASFVRPRAKKRRLVGAAAALFFMQAVAGRAADPPHVEIRGVTRIDVHAARSSGEIELSGTLSDDLDAPVGGSSLTLSVTREPAHDAADAAPSASEGRAESCGPPGARTPFGPSAAALLPLDSDAHFCTRFRLPSGRYVAHVVAAPSAFLEGTRADIPLDPDRKAVTLRFDPEPSGIDMDEDARSFDAIATTEEDGEITAANGIELQLSNEAAFVLASATTDAHGHARFQVATANLGPPGRGQLRVSFAGNANEGESVHGAPVERRTRVRLDGSTSSQSSSWSLTPEDRARVEVRAVPACAEHGCVASPTGAVEVSLGETLIGVAPLANGQARLDVILGKYLPAGAPAPTNAFFRLRFIADTPWFLPTSDAFVRRVPAPKSAWARALVTLAGLFAAAWVAASRIRRDKPDDPPPPPERRAPARAGLLVLRQGTTESDLVGLAVDAHQGDPIAGAIIRLERPGFQSTDVVCETTSDIRGHFRLRGGHVGDEIVVESRAYSTLRCPVASSGDIEVALVLRRRKLVDELVGWARRRGGRFDARPEPTPGHVRRAAGGEEPVASWAEALERAAYGGEVVDQEVEARVNRLAPSTHATHEASDEPDRRRPPST